MAIMLYSIIYFLSFILQISGITWVLYMQASPTPFGTTDVTPLRSLMIGES